MLHLLQNALETFKAKMGKYSDVKTLSFKQSDGKMVPNTVGYISKVRELLIDRAKERGFKEPGVCVSLDSGAGKFLVSGKLYDRADLSGMTT